jgi:hypothetical protein
MTRSKLARRRTPPRGRRRGDGDPRVDAAALVRCLRDHAMGRRMLRPTQLRALEIVLDKILPDLAPAKAGTAGPDLQRLQQWAAHKERSAWHAAHRAARQKAVDCSVKTASVPTADAET